MEKLGKMAQTSIDAIATWQERLKERQEALSGVPSSSCLREIPARWWEQKQRQQKLVVASMCLAEHDCEACYKYLTKYS